MGKQARTGWGTKLPPATDRPQSESESGRPGGPCARPEGLGALQEVAGVRAGLLL